MPMRDVFRPSKTLPSSRRFSVILSLLSDEANCFIADCWKDCDRVRLLPGGLVVAGEVSGAWP